MGGCLAHRVSDLGAELLGLEGDDRLAPAPHPWHELEEAGEPRFEADAAVGQPGEPLGLVPVRLADAVGDAGIELEDDVELVVFADNGAAPAIGDALARMKRADEGHDDPLSADIEFHCAILAAGNNRFFFQLREFIQVALRVSIASTNQLKGVLTADYDDHKRIYDAICAGDQERASKAVKTLLQEVMQLINVSLVKPT